MDKAGRSIGGYTLEHPLGEGGMGCVWLARRSDGRSEGRAAIKLLNCPHREATALARLAHRNIGKDHAPTQRARTIPGVMLAQRST